VTLAGETCEPLDTARRCLAHVEAFPLVGPLTRERVEVMAFWVWAVWRCPRCIARIHASAKAHLVPGTISWAQPFSCTLLAAHETVRPVYNRATRPPPTPGWPWEETMGNHDYDAIVVGARCAGSPTAMLLARKGYKVLIVDKATFPSDTISTHLIHAPGLAALQRWGLFAPLVATGCPSISTYSFDFG